ncbi:MAG: hypothetical protein EXS25_01035 [Pedosphaera sp.]|nr:hypothetical protein [Pedosphaera sp.]
MDHVLRHDFMRGFFLSSVAIAIALAPVQAQLFGPESMGGALLGGIAGGVIGHNNGRHTVGGIAIGAGVGAVLGAIVGNERRAEEGLPRHFVAAPPNPPTPSLALSGAVLGGIAGGVIGHNNGRHAVGGIAIGAGTGLLLGTLADQTARSRRETAHFHPLIRTVQVAPSIELKGQQSSTLEAAQPSSVSSITLEAQMNGSGMNPANQLFER